MMNQPEINVVFSDAFEAKREEAAPAYTPTLLETTALALGIVAYISSIDPSAEAEIADLAQQITDGMLT